MFRSKLIVALVHALLPSAIRPVWLVVRLKRLFRRKVGDAYRKRNILMVCHNAVAADHLVPIAALLEKRGIFQLRVTNDHYPSQEISNAEIKRITGIQYTHVLAALFKDWDLVIYVNHPWGFGAWFWPRIKKIYINHGLYAGKINNELGEDGVYGYHRTTRPHRGLLYTRMFAASANERDAAIVADPKLLDKVVVTGSLMADEIYALAGRRKELRLSMGIPPERRVIHVVSTWGAASLAGTVGDELLGALCHLSSPYTLLFSLHPRFDKFGGTSTTRREILAKWSAQGALVDEANAMWKRFVSVADVAIADHSSLALYHVVLGHPVIYVPVPEEAFLAESVFDVLRRGSLGIDRLEELETTLASALGNGRSAPVGVRYLVDYLGQSEQRHMQEIERLVISSE